MISKGGWAMLRRQQQQESTQIQSDAYHEVHKYSQQQQLMITPHPHTMHHATTTTTTSSPLHQETMRASKLLQIVLQWKALSAKQISSRLHRFMTESTSCSTLNQLVPLSCMRFSSFQSYSEHDDDVGSDSSKKPSIPKGYLALYVGEERRRFVVKATLVNHPLFTVLLEKAKEEFGFDQKGPLNIPCDIAFFQHIMSLIESNHKS